jgi:hypothetical protein
LPSQCTTANTRFCYTEPLCQRSIKRRTTVSDALWREMCEETVSSFALKLIRVLILSSRSLVNFDFENAR